MWLPRLDRRLLLLTDLLGSHQTAGKEKERKREESKIFVEGKGRERQQMVVSFQVTTEKECSWVPVPWALLLQASYYLGLQSR